jgi:hypothetical protein
MMFESKEKCRNPCAGIIKVRTHLRELRQEILEIRFSVVYRLVQHQSSQRPKSLLVAQKAFSPLVLP